MKLLIDANLSPRVAEALRAADFEPLMSSSWTW